jgi:hypothetical protein
MQADGKAERDAAVVMVASIPGDGQVTVGADKGYDTKGFVADVRTLNATPHVAQKKHSAIDGRTTRHEGYKISQQKRKRVEEIFGWMKTVGGLRKLRHRGLELVGWMFTFTAAGLTSGQFTAIDSTRARSDHATRNNSEQERRKKEVLCSRQRRSL